MFYIPEDDGYQPNAVDILWADKIIKKVPTDGIICFPDTKLIYRLRHTIRVLELLNAEEELESDIGQELHERTRRVFRLLGWETLP